MISYAIPGAILSGFMIHWPFEEASIIMGFLIDEKGSCRLVISFDGIIIFPAVKYYLIKS